MMQVESAHRGSVAPTDGSYVVVLLQLIPGRHVYTATEGLGDFKETLMSEK